MATVYRYTAFWTRKDGTTAYWAANFPDNLGRSRQQVCDHIKRALVSGHPHFVGAKPEAIVLSVYRLSPKAQHAFNLPGIEAAEGRAR